MPSKAATLARNGDFWRQSAASRDLALLPIVSPSRARANPFEAIKAHYEQARTICKAHGLTVQDVLTMSPKFWKLHADPISIRMGAAIVLIGSQYNLVVGTIAPYVKQQPSLTPLLQQLMDFDVSGIYMLTELGHGLDARNLQTTATMLPDGGFDLHTPTPDAAKCMPVSTPIGGLEKIAIVFARLHISGQDHGVRGFIVRLNDGERMMHGITAKLLPYRAGSNYLDHAITTFDHVRLASTALLGKVPSGPPSNHRDDFANLIWRVPIGTLSLSLSSLPSLKASAWIAGQYAMKRRVGTQSAPIIHFRTQQIPIFHTIAQAYVMEGYARWSIARFMDPAVNNRLRHAYAMLFKTVAMEHSLTSARILSQEIGWRGLFEDNQLIRFELECRGNKIAEGDITVLCIRLTSDILHGKVTIPPPRNPATLLAKHEAALLSEIQSLFIHECKSDFRTSASNRYILPRCQTLVQAIGHRMAYEAAAEGNMDPVLLRLYEVRAVKSNLAAYVEHGFATRRDVYYAEDECIEELVPRLGELLDHLGVAAYCKAPMLSDQLWKEFVGTLDTFDSDMTIGGL